MSETETRDAETITVPLTEWRRLHGRMRRDEANDAIERDNARLRGVVEAVQAIADEWAATGRALERVTNLADRRGGAAFSVCAETLRAVLAPVSSSGEAPAAVIDAAHLERQREWSARTFGPGSRLRGVLAHIRKELAEVEANPTDVEEWVDVLILAFDGAWRAGWEPQQIIDAIVAKQTKNEGRTWPDWRGRSEDEAIEHVRSSGEAESGEWEGNDLPTPDEALRMGWWV